MSNKSNSNMTLPKFITGNNGDNSTSYDNAINDVQSTAIDSTDHPNRARYVSVMYENPTDAKPVCVFLRPWEIEDAKRLTRIVIWAANNGVRLSIN